MARTSKLLLISLLFPAASWAGVTGAEVGVPVMNEFGLIGLGVSLLGVGGVALLRRRKK